jgi:hypothetical protein
MHQKAGELGMGVASFTIYGREYMEQAIGADKKAVAHAKPIPGTTINNTIGILFIGGQLASTKAKGARAGALFV